MNYKGIRKLVSFIYDYFGLFILLIMSIIYNIFRFNDINIINNFTFLYLVSSILLAINTFKLSYKINFIFAILSIISAVFIRLYLPSISDWYYPRDFLFMLYIGSIYYFFPTITRLIFIKINNEYPKLSWLMKAKNISEIKREDQILPTTIGFIQTLIFLKGFLPEFSNYQMFALLGFISFMFYRIFGFIRNNYIYRYYSSISLFFFIFMDIGFILSNYLIKYQFITDLANALFMPKEIYTFTIIIIPIIIILGLLDKMLSYRYDVE